MAVVPYYITCLSLEEFGLAIFLTPFQENESNYLGSTLVSTLPDQLLQTLLPVCCMLQVPNNVTRPALSSASWCLS